MITGKLSVRLGLVLSLIAFAAINLAACGRKNDNDRFGQLSAPSLSNDSQSEFGERFEQAASAAPTAEPMNVSDNDLPPVDPTKEPVDVR